MNKQTIYDLKPEGKTIYIRVDYNVPHDKEGHITDDRRIVATLPTLRWLLDHGAALVIASHMDRPKGEVKPCCGFASDLDQLTIGNVHTDTVARIVRRARRHPYVGVVFRDGLTAIRDRILKDNPNACR